MPRSSSIDAVYEFFAGVEPAVVDPVIQ
jgi:hypothetical protein